MLSTGEQLRYFTPGEIARLHGFPRGFSFGPIAGVDDRGGGARDADGGVAGAACGADGAAQGRTAAGEEEEEEERLTPRQCWRLVGNSVNVGVVAALLRALLSGALESEADSERARLQQEATAVQPE